MKRHPSIHFLSQLLAAGLVFSPKPAAAQSAEGFDLSGLAPEVPEAPAAPPEPDPAAAPADAGIGPSRYAGADLQAYVDTLAARLSIRTRQTDPFGRYQDPEFKAPEPKILASKPTQRFKPEPPTPLADIVAALPITMVTAEKQQFLIGDRVFSVSQIFDISLPNGKRVKLQVLSVSSRQIGFRNPETGEKASHNLDMMPDGMRRGTEGIHAPGVTPSGGNAPIEIQPVVPFSNNR